MLQITDGVESMGDIQWELTLCLFFAWVVIYMCICKGIKSSGKVSSLAGVELTLELLSFMKRATPLSLA